MATNPWTAQHWNLTRQMAIFQANPAEAERLALAAGTTLGGRRPPKPWDPVKQPWFRPGLYLIAGGRGGTTTSTVPGFLNLQGAFNGQLGFSVAVALSLELNISDIEMALGPDMEANVVGELLLEASEAALGFDAEVELETFINFVSTHGLGVDMAVTFNNIIGLTVSPALGIAMAATLTTEQLVTELEADMLLGFDAAVTFTNQLNITASPALGITMAVDVDTEFGLTPASIFGANLKAWYKADAGLTLTGSLVESWADQSGNGATLNKLDNTRRPTYAATGFNGMPTVKFNPNNDGVASCMLTANTAVSMGSGTHAAFIVCNFRGLGIGASSSFVLGFVANGQSFPWNNTSSVLWQYVGASPNPIDDLITIANSVNRSVYAGLATATLYRLGTIWDGTNSNISVNGSIVDTDAATVTLGASGRVEVGAQAGGSTTDTRARVDISEIVIINKNPSAGERTDIDNYFKAKWGLS